MKRIGIVTGVQAELAALLPAVPRTIIAGPPLPIERVEQGERTLFLACAGIGKVAAATAAATLVLGHGVELLLVIGTAGSLGAAGRGPFLITEAVQADFGAMRDERLTHYTAGDWPIGPASVEAFRAADVPDTGMARARIATSDLFVECGAHAARVRDALGATLVDMETAAVAQAAMLLGVPWAAIKATTDEADGASAGDFAANLAASARAAAQATERLIASL
ncbi:purine phosphorylase [Hephaestia sp. GCM10023244]|uniref:5'-methylthioadenosine/S-adenosylhomocysteine nucleosidase family protein n=1 Tax=unclassified Hephaestia TaxID=2631281 RepID=UPI002076E829|nr:purine phosphorylase [Hephaestia sp. MAHUQ-44]MCM8729878.1 purine phosphorylase [Hephaestia sp. MAHUQ-44]